MRAQEVAGTGGANVVESAPGLDLLFLIKKLFA